MTPKRNHDVQDPLIQETVDRLRRRVAWQVHAAYGVPLPAEPEPEPEPAPVVEAAPVEVEVAPLPPRLASLPTIGELERLVAAAESSERTQQWTWTLYYLRGFSDSEGKLPPMFEPLVQMEFAPLLAA
jgi:hypothetical protein